MKKKHVILFYNTMFNAPLSYPSAEIPDEFAITTDRSLLREAVAVVFHIPSLFSPLRRAARCIPSLYSMAMGLQRFRKQRGQLWVAWFMECPLNIPHFNDPDFLDYFDLTMSHHLDADIVTPYFYPGLHGELRRPVQEKNAENMVCAFISSPFHKSGRLEYIQALMQYLDIHSYGKVLGNRVLALDTGRQTKLETIARYKFTIAFENAISQDYVTEKFYDPLIAGSVPVYLGAPNVEDFAPGERCYINASHWVDPESLAHHLVALSGDAERYRSYFSWKSQPFRSSFRTMLAQQKDHAFVRLCRKIQERV